MKQLLCATRKCLRIESRFWAENRSSRWFPVCRIELNHQIVLKTSDWRCTFDAAVVLYCFITFLLFFSIFSIILQQKTENNNKKKVWHLSKEFDTAKNLGIFPSPFLRPWDSSMSYFEEAKSSPRKSRRRQWGTGRVEKTWVMFVLSKCWSWVGKGWIRGCVLGGLRFAVILTPFGKWDMGFHENQELMPTHRKLDACSFVWKTATW